VTPEPSSRPAVFLDRDGTITDDPGYLKDPADVKLLPGAGASLARLNAAGYLAIVITNQSGIAREKLTWEQYRRVAARLDELLAAEGAHLDATYVCPHAPERDGPCPCRKPGLQLFQRAAAEHRIDLSRSWWVGDRIGDVEPARALGGRGLLVLTGHGSDHQTGAHLQGFTTAADFPAAVAHLLG
jgi:histidinol-phosphate phosphatase family protein